MRKSQYQFLAFLLLAPAIVFADGVSPVLNFFHKDTWIPASIVTLVIILLESALLRWRIKGMPFTGVLWRSFLFNAASSLTGSVLLIVFSKDSFVMWDSMSFVFPLFLITLFTEIPLLHVLFKGVPLSWKRAVILGSGINVASYAAVFIIEIGLLVGWLSYARHLDQKELVKWNNPDLLKQASGLIYATESLYRTTMAEVHGSTSYGIGYARDDRFKQGLYVFDIESGETARFADDGAPSLAVETGAILVQDQSGLVLLNSAGEIQEQIKDSRVGFRGAVVSPSGEMILAEVWRHSPFLFGGRLILYHKTAPELRHMLDDGFAYRFDWTRIGD